MRMNLAKILLTCLLLTVTGVYGIIAKPGSYDVSVSHERTTSEYSHSSLDTDSELELSITHAVSSSSQQAGFKKIAGFGSIENEQGFSYHQNNLFSSRAANTYSHSVHLLLIFPFHYFW